MANHFNLPGHLLEENLEILLYEQSPILGSKTKTDILNLEREAFWIRTFGIKVESGKSVQRNADIGKIVKEEYLNLKTVLYSNNPII